MIGSTNGTTTISYGYDHTGARVLMDNGTDAYHYPNRYYNISGATSTKHVFANNELVATIESNGATSTIYYIHSDHLGGSSVITDQEGEIQQVLDYLPFGDIRINENSGFDEQRKFTGHEYDAETGLNYMVARFQNSAIGRFLSVDPLVSDIGKFEFEKTYNEKLEMILGDPQSLNSYSYSKNNPLIYIDPIGKEATMFQGLLSSLNGANKQTNGYVARNINTSIQGAKQAIKATGIAVGAMATAVFAPELGASSILGGLTNAALRGYNDYSDNGSIDDSMGQYAGSAAFGITGGYILGGQGILVTGLGSGIIEGFENAFVDDKVDPTSVSASTIAGMTTRGLFGKESVQTTQSLIQQSLSNLPQAVTEFVTNVASSEFIKGLFNGQ